MQQVVVFHLDDDLFALDRVREHLQEQQQLCAFTIHSFEAKDTFFDALSGEIQPDLILLDIHLGNDHKGSGIAIAAELRARHWPGPIVAYSTDFASIRQSLLAGASDFVLKTESMESLATRLFALHRHFAGSEQALQPTANSRVVPAIGDTMRQVANRLRQIQGSAINAIHISGESGTGKEVVADLWHSVQTTRKPFLKVNCAAISPHLLESELFGHVRGAFTGAVSDKSGFLEAASGGSLFLDEVACLSMPAQAALLRALESREIIRVGDTKARSVDLKILSASNLPLESLVSKGLFRNDLLQRLREAEIVLPPLRERKKEICQFIEHFCATEAGGPYRMEDEARRLLENAEWTDGNIRALRNAIRGMTEHQIDRCLTPKSIPAWVWRQIEGSSEFVLQAEPAARSLVIPLPNGEIPQFDQLEDLLFAEAIRYVHKMEGSQSIRTLGEALGIPKTTLANHLSRVRKLGLIPEAELDIIVAAKTKGKG